MNFKKQKELAARTLKVSKKRIKLDINSPDSKKSLKELISREGVKELLEEKIIKKLPKKGISRTRANYILEQKKKGRRKGQGSRKGTANARLPRKDKWMIKIRALRTLLKDLKEKQKIDSKTHKDLYLKAKGNFFRNKRHLMIYIEQNNLIMENKENEKSE